MKSLAAYLLLTGAVLMAFGEAPPAVQNRTTEETKGPSYWKVVAKTVEESPPTRYVKLSRREVWFYSERACMKYRVLRYAEGRFFELAPLPQRDPNSSRVYMRVYAKGPNKAELRISSTREFNEQPTFIIIRSDDSNPEIIKSE